MNTRQQLLCGVAMIAVRPFDDQGRPRDLDCGLAGNPNGFKVRVSKRQQRSDAAWSEVESVKRRLRSGPTLTNASGHLGRRGAV